MNNRLTSISLVCLIVIGGFVGFVNFGSENVQGTDVSGPIVIDTIWDLGGSPYIVVGDVTVGIGVTLTIEPGVQVKFDDYLSIFVDGSLEAIGTEINRIIITSNEAIPASWDWKNIHIKSTGHAEIKYCDIFYAYAAISLYSSNNNITNNNLWNNNWGIEILGSSNNNITGNDFDLNDAPSIIFYSSSNNIIAYNDLSNSDWGLYLMGSSNETITNNNISNNRRGIFLWDSINITITNNNFVNDGVYLDGNQLSHYNSHYIPDDNIVNGKPLLYYKDTSNINIDGGIPVGQVILANCTDIEVRSLQINSIEMGIQVAYSTNIIIANNDISLNDLDGIRLFESSNNIITDNNVSNNRNGISLLESSNNNIVTKNNVSWNNDIGASAGIRVFESSSNYIIDNYVWNNFLGIGLFSSLNNTVTGNNVLNNDYGMSIGSWSSYNVVKENIISSNNYFNLGLSGSSNNNIIDSNKISNGDYGLIVESSSNDNVITDNTITSNNNGCFLEDTSNNIIANNNISNNGEGIILRDSSDNEISGNTISSNDNNGIYSWLSTNNITNNDISDNLRGIYLRRIVLIKYNMIRNNIISNNDYGIYLNWTSNNMIYHNNIIGNTIQAYDNRWDNYWDNGYPSGGNYWSDFDESSEGAYDEYNGLNQLSLGSDGIVDNGTIGGGGKNPYVIDSDSQDNYPLIEPIKNFMILKQGWNLISIPLIQQEKSLTKVLESIDGLYDAVQWYNITDTIDPWKHYKVGKPLGNDLFELNETMGFWIHITQSGDTIFFYNGTQLIVNQKIALHPGWNLVGYPSTSNKDRTSALNNIDFPNDVDAIWTFNSVTQIWEEMGPSDSFEIGRGYWIHSKVTEIWNVPL